MAKPPLVSVITPCFNQGNFLRQTIDSLFKQSFENWECIIINDGSTDNTEEIALQLIEEDSRITYLKQENQGVSAARNTAIQNASGTYIIPLDADDLFHPDYIMECVKVFEREQDASIVYCRAEKFGAESGPWELGVFNIDTMIHTNQIFNAAMFKKKEWEKTGGFDSNLIVGEDWEFWISILEQGGKVEKLDFVGFYYRIHKKSRLQTYDWEQLDYLNYVFKKHTDFFISKLGNPILLYRKNLANQRFVDKVQNLLIYKLLKKLI